MYYLCTEIKKQAGAATRNSGKKDMKLYTIKDETGNFHGDFNSIRAAIQFIHKHYADRKMTIWRYESWTNLVQVIYK